jgi:hypothetical protein
LQRAAADARESAAKAADRMLRPVLGRETAKTIVHYACESAVGGLYGVAAEHAPITKSLGGAPFGATVFNIPDRRCGV